MTAAAASPSRYVVGIDLGTTNSALAFVDTTEPEKAPQIFPVPQIVAPGEIEKRDTLPSFHYEPASGELSAGALQLPWTESNGHAVGHWARDHGANAPARLVVSAKSWLSHSGVDRTADFLPWHGADDAKKLSPVEASARYLAHLRHSWNHAHPADLLEDQDVVLTIPASFDEVARELTVSAARRAGLPRIVLIEEPLAAFYNWMQSHDVATTLQAGETILVCDVGGGTTDFTLIAVESQNKLRRFAVGDHLILGGDNLDLALAHHAEQRLGVRLTPRQWSILVRKCQQAKEALLSQKPFTVHQSPFTLSIPAEGVRLIGGSLQVEFARDEVAALLVDGFLPRVAFDENPARRASGFQEFGLPYAPDFAITRYLAAFLRAHGSIQPDLVLFNGGLFESPLMRERLIDVIASWFGRPPRILGNDRLDLAVALGAAWHGMVRRGAGVKISGGLARSYYIGIRTGNDDVAICVAPAGLDEGHSATIENRQFELLTRQPVEFPLFVSSLRTNDKPGDVIPVDPLQLTALPPIRTVLKAKTDTVTVELHARLTEIGTLELWCAEKDGKGSWRLQFDVRAATQTDVATHEATGEQAGFLDETIVETGRALLRKTFESANPPERIVKELEAVAGLGRLDWPPSLLRSFWETLLPLESARRRSPSHEARWLNLTGFCLRPGFGFAVDDWRVAQTWRVFERKIAHPKNEHSRAEWWILWRRIAAGLTAGQQHILAEPLVATVRRDPAKAERAEQLARHEWTEIWRLLGSLELLPIAFKTLLGEILVRRLEQKTITHAQLWTLGRLGARAPWHGSLNTILPAETAEAWASRFLQRSPEKGGENAHFALAQLTRRTGDRHRDISDSVRQASAAWLQKNGASQRDIALVVTGIDSSPADASQTFGEALPKGLRVIA
ncbi:MAG TPA: Hsp70 family protein [Chthoniobacterales bacterium]